MITGRDFQMWWIVELIAELTSTLITTNIKTSDINAKKNIRGRETIRYNTNKQKNTEITESYRTKVGDRLTYRLLEQTETITINEIWLTPRLTLKVALHGTPQAVLVYKSKEQRIHYLQLCTSHTYKVPPKNLVQRLLDLIKGIGLL